jgi:Ca2+-binding EF-hand superfamily protein
MVAVEIPGKVLEDMITTSRQGIHKDPPVANGGYLHHCDQVKYSNDTCKIESIGGEPFDPEEKYLTTFPGQFFDGIDNHESLLEWAKENNIRVDNESGKPVKLAIIEMFAALLWLDMGSFADIDKDGDGIITRDEVKARAIEVFGVAVADLVVESVMGVADLNGNGTITPIEMMVVRFVATDILDHVATNEELCAMNAVAAQVLGKRPSHVDVKRVVSELHNILDEDGTGKITRDEAMRVLGEVRRRSLLI